VRSRHLLIGAAAAFLLTACGELPKPFAHSGPDLSNPLLRLADGGGIQVSAAPELPEEIAGPLMAAAVKGLADANVPATVNSDLARGFRLIGGVRIETDDAGGPETARFVWRLNGPDGAEIGAFDQTITGDTPGWLTEDQQIFDIIAADAGQRIAEILRGQKTGADAAAGKTVAGVQPSLYLVGVDGAPGDGNRSLIRALRLVVGRAGGKVSDTLDTATHLVMGSVEVSGGMGGPGGEAESRLLTVSWAVTGLDGVELGKISQSNQVPKKMIAGRWGGLAYAVAKGAGDGIFEILESSRKPARGRKPLRVPAQPN